MYAHNRPRARIHEAMPSPERLAVRDDRSCYMDAERRSSTRTMLPRGSERKSGGTVMGPHSSHKQPSCSLRHPVHANHPLWHCTATGYASSTRSHISHVFAARSALWVPPEEAASRPRRAGRTPAFALNGPSSPRQSYRAQDPSILVVHVPQYYMKTRHCPAFTYGEGRCGHEHWLSTFTRSDGARMSRSARARIHHPAARGPPRNRIVPPRIYFVFGTTTKQSRRSELQVAYLRKV